MSTDTGHDGVTVAKSDSLRPLKGRTSIPAVDEKQNFAAIPDITQRDQLLVQLSDTKKHGDHHKRHQRH
jgi:hypothetical protein